MKTLLSIGALLIALPILQILPPPPPSPPPPPQRGQAPAAAVTPATPQPAPLTAAECRCSIDITVKRQSNGEPISDVAIMVTFNAPRPANSTTAPPTPVPLTAMTDTAGRAVFPNLAEGQYTISAQRDGFLGPVNNGGAPTQVNTSALIGPAPKNVEAVISRLEAAGIERSGISSLANVVQQPVQHIAIQMIQGAIISGQIRDANHRPASGIQVVPLQIIYQNGQRLMRQTATAVQTDDLGEFRLFWFAPGEYYIRTLLPPAQTARAGGANYPGPTYYPGTMDLAQARPIVVREGQEVSGSDVDLQMSAGVTISGTVINTLPGLVNATGQVNHRVSQFFLVPRNSNVFEPIQAIPNPAPNGARGAAASANDATEFPFEIRGVPPGAYDFYPIFNDGASPRANTYTGHITIEVAAENITGVKTAIQPGVDLKVHVSVNGTPPALPNNRPAQPVSIQNMRVQIRPFENLPNPLANSASISLTNPDKDGNILLTNLPEARFYINYISPLPQDAYVSEMRLGSRSIMDDTIINIGKETPDPLEIFISRGGGTISGTIVDAQGKPLTNARVNLIPDPPRRGNILLYKNTTSSTMGTFNFQGIAPGAYKIFAWDDLPQGAEQNSEFVSRYEALGTRVIVSTGTPATNIQVTLIRNQENR